MQLKTNERVKDMKKRYTKKQIQESIAYWKKQLKLGNYKKLNESLNDEELRNGPNGEYVWYLDEFIDYDDDDDPTNPFNTIESTVKNIPRLVPGVKAYEGPTHTRGSTGGGLILVSNDLDALKKAVIYVSHADGVDEYKRLVKSGRLEDELESSDFYGNVSSPVPSYVLAFIK